MERKNKNYYYSQMTQYYIKKKNPKDATKKIPEFMNEFEKVSETS